MHRPAVPDAYIEEVAERTDFAVEDVRIGLRVLHDAVQDRIVEQYRRARDDSTPNHLLTDDAESAWFAFAFADLRAELEAAGYEMDADLLAAVAAVNMTVFQEVHDRTVSFPRNLADASDTPFFYPVYVAKPDWWREAETRALRSLVGLLESGSSPAAALDAWAVDAAGADPDEWADLRGVSAERVRANAEKAPDPAPEAADGLRAEAREGVPDGPYDPETDRLFVPTTDQLAAAREASEEDEGEGSNEADTEDSVGTDHIDAGDDSGPTPDPDSDPDPDGLADIDPDDLLAGEVEAADLPEYAVQGSDGDDADSDADDGGRVIDGAAAFDREDGNRDGDDGSDDNVTSDGQGDRDRTDGDDR
ncbi:hypothetical protein [Halobaculum magnesiiphilum]|uniref:Uncharacterized protein n=1 Tax=Halobaculum magnesiiphilum TaxID=1017351 RepID=A0A8T8W8Z6_9EURY|nr:hypothetical protein [Halobaculum magnesiiphilum]QZP36291.1 hypothetical protein K6T50_08020 [Halobaculum magnesiiphilum]